MKKIEQDDHVTESDLDKFIATHAVRPDLMRADNFDDYFVDRAKSLVGMISAAMGKPISNLSGEDVVEAFGAPLG